MLRCDRALRWYRWSMHGRSKRADHVIWRALLRIRGSHLQAHSGASTGAGAVLSSGTLWVSTETRSLWSSSSRICLTRSALNPNRCPMLASVSPCSRSLRISLARSVQTCDGGAVTNSSHVPVISGRGGAAPSHEECPSPPGGISCTWLAKAPSYPCESGLPGTRLPEHSVLRLTASPSTDRHHPPGGRDGRCSAR